MPNSYLEGKIKKYDTYKFIMTLVLIFCALFTGRFLFDRSILVSSVGGLLLGVIGGIVLLFIEHYTNKQSFYKKGLDLEDKIAKKLDDLKIKYEQHIENNYGDLDFFITKDEFYGMEVKNWSGEVVFENGLLKVAGWERTDVLISLLRSCKLIRNEKFGENPTKFVKPVLVFGHKAIVNIPQNKIMFNKVEVTVATIKDFEKFIK